MASYTVEITRTVVSIASISITAEDDDDATEQADKICEDAANLVLSKELAKAEWDDDSVEYTVNSVDED